MNADELCRADRPTFYFIGVTTGKSSIMTVFPKWAAHLGLDDCPMVGIDCKWHDQPAVYRKVVAFLKTDPLSLGALVTTHKIDVLDACRDMLDELDPYAELLGEISCLSKRQGRLRGHAKDPITSGLAMEAFLDGDHWRKTGAEVCILGAGGSSLAFTTYFMRIVSPEHRPGRIIVTNRSVPRLEAMRRVHGQINPGIEVEYHHCPRAEDNDQVVSRLRPGSLVANATGLGKDAPGSPITEAARFPQGGYAWDFNYRGELVFLTQANAQKQARNLHVEDGWVYFVHGWTRVIAEVFDIDIPTSGRDFDELSRIAAEAR
jgi:shikimate 5-dehydrogenase